MSIILVGVRYRTSKPFEASSSSWCYFIKLWLLSFLSVKAILTETLAMVLKTLNKLAPFLLWLSFWFAWLQPHWNLCFSRTHRAQSCLRDCAVATLLPVTLFKYSHALSPPSHLCLNVTSLERHCLTTIFFKIVTPIHLPIPIILIHFLSWYISIPNSI